jgi:branched-chain amino acid transport system permease protein
VGYALSMMELCGLNILLALSVYATLMVGQFSLAQVGFWSIGAYAGGILTTLYGFPLIPALLASGTLCAAIGILLGYPCLRIRGIYLALATVAFSEVVRIFFHNFDFQIVVNGVTLGPGGPLGFRGILVMTAWPQILVAVVVMVAVFAWLERSRVGLSANAVREDEIAAACAGINVVAIKVGMFAFGAFVAGMGGGLYATYISFVNADNFGFHLALISIFYVAIGGTRRFAGPIIGAILLTILPEALRFAGDFRMAVYGIVVLVLMLIFPRGLADELAARAGWLRRLWSAPSAPDAGHS